jgi:hypothetical protein
LLALGGKTGDDDVHLDPIQVRPGSSLVIPPGRSKLLVSEEGEQSALVYLSCRERDSPDGEFLHGGRSYDGRVWEASPPLNLPFTCHSAPASSELCDFQVPPTKTCRLTGADEIEPPSEDEEAARFLIKTSFGPTTNDISSFPSTKKEYFNAQTSLPLTSHREYYRKRVNDRKLAPSDAGSVTPPCEQHSRWSRFAFSTADIGGTFTHDSDTLTITTNVGVKTSSLDTPLPSCEGAGAPPFNICTVYVDGLADGGSVTYGESCRCAFPNVKLVFTGALSGGPVVSQIADNNADLVPLVPPVTGTTILNAVSGSCTPPVSLRTPTYAKSKHNTEWYIYDPRISLSSNDVASPPTTGHCEAVPKTFLNARTCVPKAASCSPLTYTRDVEVTLTPELLRKYFTLSGRPVHYMTGLRLNEEQTNQLVYSDSPVCEARTPTRWMRTVGACGSEETPVGTDLDSTTKNFLQKQLNAASIAEDNDDLHTIDIPIARLDDECVTASAGVKITAVESTTKTWCYSQTHPHTHNVYDFTKWSVGHPGNVQARAGQRATPIEKKASFSPLLPFFL